MSDTTIGSQSISDLAMYTGAETPTVASSELGKDQFLQMLVAQLRYQDPMEPMKDQEFIGQLAQFSALEQMTNMNDNLTENLNWNYLLSQTINNTMATSLIGKDIKASGNEFYLSSDGEGTLAYNLGGFADTVEIAIYNGIGETVATYTVEKVGSGDQVFTWDGHTSSGDTASAGTYTFQITAKDSSSNAVTATPFMEGTVEGVRYVDGQAYLVVNGALISLSSVSEVGSTPESGEDNG